MDLAKCFFLYNVPANSASLLQCNILDHVLMQSTGKPPWENYFSWMQTFVLAGKFRGFMSLFKGNISQASSKITIDSLSPGSFNTSFIVWKFWSFITSKNCFVGEEGLAGSLRLLINFGNFSLTYMKNLKNSSSVKILKL